jgi:DNA-directed RNA polymerase specialized sigma24 family protein
MYNKTEVHQKGSIVLATASLLDQDQLDELAMADALIPRLRSHQQVVVMPEATMDELLWVLPNQMSISAVRPQRQACHRLRKLVRMLNGRERKAIYLLYFREMSHPEVLEKMGLLGNELDEAIEHAFARLRAGLGDLVVS